MLHRSYSICSDFDTFLIDAKRIKQLLINNNFPNFVVDKTVKSFIDNKLNGINRRLNSESQQSSDDETVTYFYQNQMTENYVKYEQTLKKNNL